MIIAICKLLVKESHFSMATSSLVYSMEQFIPSLHPLWVLKTRFHDKVPWWMQGPSMHSNPRILHARHTRLPLSSFSQVGKEGLNQQSSLFKRQTCVWIKRPATWLLATFPSSQELNWPLWGTSSCEARQHWPWFCICNKYIFTFCDKTALLLSAVNLLKTHKGF